ncbi:hypothetical protein E2C01_055186 [Portunus trituberculatus]|uniref:Uncharacterized protein n=1 Tax=Portunus trituberculatus TaxID=210409 RepID=A0A5B7GQI6_PORTR|nr:hypothetical protein [Portunus trituberculatus]
MLTGLISGVATRPDQPGPVIKADLYTLVSSTTTTTTTTTSSSSSSSSSRKAINPPSIPTPSQL